MDKIRIHQGGIPLFGQITIGGSKNAALPLMAASLLTDETLTLSNLPHLADISTMANLLIQHGVDFRINGCDDNLGSNARVIDMNAASIHNRTAPYDIVRKMRASVLVLGPLLARFGEATVSLPGGCAIGTRPIDLHLMAFEKLGATIDLTEGYIHASAPNGLKGNEITFDKVSVGATENTLMAASLAEGETIINNAAREPEVVDLAKCLIAMGADISGEGSDQIIIKGVAKLHGINYSVIPDRIEAGSYAIAAAITGGEIELLGITDSDISSYRQTLEDAGIVFTPTEKGISVSRNLDNVKDIIDVNTEPYPGFPTDMQAQLMTYLATIPGTWKITEHIFENRYMHVPELCRMGANITIQSNTSIIEGVLKLNAAQVMATDLRASVSLVLAGLAAEGETTINRVYHIDRGYEWIEDKLSACGAKIERTR
ncbi:MAG: UDP-N-acetylglucosamine 1-carboxyvinyltransferase [Rickettsiales bacterium]|nr:UDP-N-acetylglucosamine 1-carboxyvinyltransferase [Rickettsiales bacterium]